MIDGRAGSARHVYDLVYGSLCGTPPRIRPWHFQWLATKDLYRVLRDLAPSIQGRLLDVGCGWKPYRAWFTGIAEYVGVDVTRESAADIVVGRGQRWPVEDATFDAVLSTQVMEHASDFDNVRDEMARVLKPGGMAIVSVPFIFNEHGAPDDYRRFSAYGATTLFPANWRVARLERLGGFGSSAGVLFLNWVEISTTRTSIAKVVKGLLLPVWILFSAVINAVAVALDQIGDRQSIYVNVLAVYVKPGQDEN